MLGIMAGMTQKDSCLEDVSVFSAQLGGYMVCVSLRSGGIPRFSTWKMDLDPVVDPRPFSRGVTSLRSLVFSTLHGFFCSPLYLAVTCTVFGVRMEITSGMVSVFITPLFDSGYPRLIKKRSWKSRTSEF